MTTIVGIKANSGVEGIVIATDRQLNHYDDAGKTILRKETISKIVYGREWIIADAGGISNQFAVFQNMDQEKMKQKIYRAVQRYKPDPPKDPQFREINRINTIARRNDATLDCLHELVMAAKIDENLGLWHVDEFGSLTEYEFEPNYFTMGSGKDHVTKYITSLAENGKINNYKLSLPAAIEIAVEAIKLAEEDPNTVDWI